MSPMIALGTTSKPMELAIREAYESFGLQPLGGASEDGWSKLADLQRCPYRYKMLHETLLDVDEVAGPKPVALELGALYHTALALHYSVGTIAIAVTPFAFLERVRAVGGDGVIIDECKRLYSAYFDKYGNAHNEGFAPLAIEFPAGIPGTHTCRFDMLAKHEGVTKNIEHKTASRETRDVLEGWWLDGEIIGQHYAYKLSGLEAKFGPLFSTVVNLTIKTKEPKFRRIEVVISDEIIGRFASDRAWWNGHRDALRGGSYWPRKLQGCIGRYSNCELWDHCSNASASDDLRLNQLLTKSLEGGEK